MSTCDPRDTFTFWGEDEAIPNSIIMCADSNEMIRISPDGFYVRGVKVPADNKEAKAVYEAFKEFLVWSQLTRA